jgi:hypothetical protein
MFDERGRIRIPEKIAVRKPQPGEKVVINAAYCPEGHNLVSLGTEVGGYPGLLLKFSGSAGGGLVAISAVLGDNGKCIIQGKMEPGEALKLSCPVCDTPLDVLGECSCTEGALSVVAYLYPRRDPYQAIAFCNSLSCDNSAVIRSHEVIRTHTDKPWQS